MIHSCAHVCRWSTAALAMILLLTMSARADSEVAPDRAMAIVTTTAMVGDIVRNVAGERAEVRVLMGANVDPHLYRPTRSDVNQLLQADVIFYNGLNLEGKMSDTFVQIARSGRPVYAVTELIDESYLLTPEAFEGHFDPHVWMDPRGWMKATEAVAQVLAEIDAAAADSYRANARRYLAELEALDAYAREAIETIPSAQRVLVTAHDAFNYFARAYGLTVEAIQGISTDSQAGLHRIETLVNLLVERRIGAVFTETSVSDQQIRALIEGAQARGHAVRIGGELFSDAMGQPGTYRGTYIGMIDHNVTTIVRALGGTAPEGGFRAARTSPGASDEVEKSDTTPASREAP